MSRNFTLRGVFVGCLIGVLINLSNTYYGLIAGSSQQMPIVSALLGFLIFKSLSRLGIELLSKAENVLIASTATATGCMPVTAGFAELIPALEYVLDPEDGGPVRLSWAKRMLWSLGLCFFGILFAALLRNRLVEPNNMPWPGATASSNVIQALYIEPEEAPPYSDELNLSLLPTIFPFDSDQTIVILLVPILRDIPILGPTLAHDCLWSLTLSPGFFGGGMIMGPEITLYMLTGAIVGWGILSLYVKQRGGWTVWISLSALVADAFVKISWIYFQPLWAAWGDTVRNYAWQLIYKSDYRGLVDEASSGYTENTDETDCTGSDPEQPPQIKNVSNSRAGHVFISGLLFLASIGFCMFATSTVFGKQFPLHYIFLSVLLALPMAVVSIRTLGESDYNPQSGIVSQLFFALITTGSRPGAVIVNVVSAAIATAGASQTGDLAYDFKIGQLVGATHQAQMNGQLIGSVFGAIISTLTYKLYVTRFQVPGPFLQIPASFLQISTAKLVLGRGLPEGAPQFSFVIGLIFSVLTAVKTMYADRYWQKFIPSGVSFAVGMLLLPAYTLSRTAGGLFTGIWLIMNPSRNSSIEVIGSGLILGESIASLADLVFAAFNVPQFGPK
ncbi:OPT oligopeptide transporter protein-domain-containing protein [Lophiotrema nucula]|uniref:OPT oligopeptide transporter protein-domain-containing protein n=1 Tax=Lophiotrema nucula TaxID=690887 RepID=A0A6A5YJ66_9PLEO|nr:OPT oligopeptide transporter protein-domain-containing protein [Lophiotrema nucula]